MLRPVGFAGVPAAACEVGEDLKFTLKSVPPLRYAVTVAGVPETCYVQSIKYGGSEVTEAGVEMTSGRRAGSDHQRRGGPHRHHRIG